MAFRSTTRTPTFRPQLSIRRVYETMEPRSEMKETPEAYHLHVYLPGFSRDRVKITYEGSLERVKITGERPILGNRWVRIDQSYPIPPNCEGETLQGKFEFGILIVTMPKKVIPQVAPKQPEVETTQDHRSVTEAKPDEKSQETIPPQQPITTKIEESIEDKKSVSFSSPIKELVDSKTQKATHEDTSSQIPPEPIKDYSPQKGQEEVEPKPETSKAQKGQEEATEKPPEISEPQKGQEEVESKPTPTMPAKMQTDEESQKDQEKVDPNEKPQKDQEKVEPKSTPTMLTNMQTAENPQKDPEEVESKPTPTMTTKIQTDEKPQKDQEEFEPKSTPTMISKIKTEEQPPIGKEESGSIPTITTTITKSTEHKLQEDNGVKTTLETTMEQLVEYKTEGTNIADDPEKEKISKKEDHENPFESRKLVKDKENGSFKEKESKVNKSTTKETKSPAPNVRKKEKESSNKTTSKKERKFKEDTKDTEGSGIKELVDSASQVVTRIVEGKFNEQDKHLAANIAAAFLVIAALGAYVSYRFAS